MDPAALHDEVAGRLGRLQQRYTSNRRRVVEVLAEAPRPLTLPELLGTDPTLSQSSTYRSLAVLEEAGAVSRLVTGPDRAHFELAEGLTDRHHHHLVCEGCGEVTDVELDDDTESRLDQVLRSVASDHGFESGRHTLDVFGRCGRCA